MMMKEKHVFRLFFILSLFVLLLLSLACDETKTTVNDDTDDPDDTRDDSTLGDRCDSNFDCGRNEVCFEERCHRACEEDGDCVNGYRCNGEVCIEPEDINEMDGDQEENPMPDGDDDDAPPIVDGDAPPLPDGDRTDAEEDNAVSPDCLDTSDCELGELCIEGECVAGCASSRDCPDGLMCATDLGEHGRCVECLIDADCEMGERCKDNQCKFVCRTDEDCAASQETPVCDTQSGLCAQCTHDNHCDIGFICAQSDCVEGCRSSRDCPDPLYCDERYGDFGACFACLEDAHCTSPEVCLNHDCQIDCASITCPDEAPTCVPDTGECVQCLTSDDCGQGRVCLERTCVVGCDDDNDCPRNQYCDGVGAGSCVNCLNDDHCTGELRCVSGNCIESGCEEDADCGFGYYCHPNLAECVEYPVNGCQSNQDCGGNPLSPDICDPLTRLCIPGCYGMPICLFSPDRLFCIDGGCYECTSDTYCVGTACDPFSNVCVHCESDADCQDQGDHCNTENGRCYECLEDNHCIGGVCDVDENECVDCLSDDDCLDPAYPECGKDNTCIPPCEDECVSGEERCAEDDPQKILDCGDHDNDSCLEFGDSYSDCVQNQVCDDSTGQARCLCLDECEEGEAYCDTTEDELLRSCQEDYYGCLYWSSSYCPATTTCQDGECICEVHCTQTDKRCIDGDPAHFEVCVPNSNTGCMYWAGRTCRQGTECIGEDVCPY